MTSYVRADYEDNPDYAAANEVATSLKDHLNTPEPHACRS